MYELHHTLSTLYTPSFYSSNHTELRTSTPPLPFLPFSFLLWGLCRFFVFSSLLSFLLPPLSSSFLLPPSYLSIYVLFSFCYLPTYLPYNLQLTTYNLQLTTYNLQLTTYNLQPPPFHSFTPFFSWGLGFPLPLLLSLLTLSLPLFLPLSSLNISSSTSLPPP